VVLAIKEGKDVHCVYHTEIYVHSVY